MAIDKEKVKTCLVTYCLTGFTVIGVFLGVVLGFILRSIEREKWWSKREVMYVQFVGDIYLRMLNCLVLPFMISSIISAVGSLELKTSWRIGVRCATWLVVVQFLAVVEGIIFAVAIQPGEKSVVSGFKKFDEARNVMVIDTILDIFRNLYPPNIVKASLTQYRTVLIPPENSSVPISDWVISHKYHDGTNILGTINFSIFLALAVGIMSRNSKPILEFFGTLERCMTTAIGWALLLEKLRVQQYKKLLYYNRSTWLWNESLTCYHHSVFPISSVQNTMFSPVGILFLLAAKLIEVQDLSTIVEKLGFYFMTVLIGLFIHCFVVLPSIYFAIVRKSPFTFMGNLTQAMFTAFGTASSSITMPVAIECLEKRNKVEERIARFTLPIGTTLNMDGTALYEAVAVIFLAQGRDIELDFGNICLICITVTAACLGGAGIPQAGLAIMIMILTSLNLPAEDVTMVIAIDWLLDRFRTTVNVISDCFGAGVVEHLSKVEIERLARYREYRPVAQEIELSERM